MTADLVAFLRTRLDEDEATALAALPRRIVVASDSTTSSGRAIVVTRTSEPNTSLRWAAGDGDGVVYRHVGLDSPSRCDEHPAGVPNMCDDVAVVQIDDQSSDIEEGVLTHIARHDPASVLAEVTAKRRILDEWTGAQEEAERDDLSGRVAAFALALALGALAMPYAEHEDYRSEWTP